MNTQESNRDPLHHYEMQVAELSSGMHAYRELDPDIKIRLEDCSDLAYAMLGLAGECGECADILKKHVFHGHDLDIDHLRRELGDVLWYVTDAAHALGCSLYDIMAINSKKINSRYPNGFDPERSIHRDTNDT